MKKPVLITSLTLLAFALGAAGLLAALGAFSGSLDDPTVAPCRRPPTTVSAPRAVLDHREALVRFICNETQLSGTLYLPLRAGRYPAVVWVHGSGEQPRLSYGPLVASFVDDGIAFFSYDKRGVADSEGSCCPDEHGHFNLVTADAVGAIEAIRSSSAVDNAQVGFVGASAAGWIAPRAAEESSHVAFIALASPGVLQHSLVARFEQEAADGRAPTSSSGSSPHGSSPASTRRRTSRTSTSRLCGSSAAATATCRHSTASRSSGRSSSNATRTGRSSSSPEPVTGSSTSRPPTPAPHLPPRRGCATMCTSAASAGPPRITCRAMRSAKPLPRRARLRISADVRQRK